MVQLHGEQPVQLLRRDLEDVEVLLEAGVVQRERKGRRVPSGAQAVVGPLAEQPFEHLVDDVEIRPAAPRNRRADRDLPATQIGQP
ncbi:hypothetical protein GCM10022221_66760 [Actinocorallia aurea]